MTAAEIPRIQFATTSDDVRIAFGALGEGHPLIFIQGWVAHLELDWQRPETVSFYQRLARAGQLIRYDGRGTGLSDRRVDDLSLPARVKDLDAIVSHLGLEQYSIFAWSQGTPVAIVHAAENPERVTKLILYAPFCESFLRTEPEDRAAVGRALLDLIRAEWGVGARTTMGFIHPDADREEQRQALAYLRESSSGEAAAGILEEGMFRTEVCHYLTRITAPALVLHRRDDNAVPLECGRQVASMLPNARFLPLDGDHHLPWDGNTESLLHAVDEFLGVEPLPAASTTTSAEPVSAGSPITILFTDMEDSTGITERLGDAKAQELLRTHNTIVRDSLRAHGGSEIKHTGDGIMVSFPSASGAVECAIAIQRALAQRNQEHPDAPIHVRIGLNVGEPVREEADLFGTAVQLARRICDRAEPDQIIASNVVRELVAGKGFLFADLGETALRGFEDSVRLYEARWVE